MPADRDIVIPRSARPAATGAYSGEQPHEDSLRLRPDESAVQLGAAINVTGTRQTVSGRRRSAYSQMED